MNTKTVGGVTHMERYLELEETAMLWVKEVAWLALVMSLVYRVVTETPVSSGFEEWSRYILIATGALLIPGWLLRICMFVFTLRENKG